MREIGEPVPESWIIESVEQLQELTKTAPYPCIIRPAYTLGGTGGGVANTPEELLEIGKLGLMLSMRSQIMVERSLLGWKEVEYEVMRDSADNCITICNMENLDPMGVHTGDSIVVAPSQTLSDIEYHMLRSASLKIIRALGVEGGCNVQLAVNPKSYDYYVIEVNPRVSRSSALASKATGYPIARVSAKIAIGKTLDQIENAITKTTKACFEPALDYCVVKIPRWPFDKFASGDRRLSTQMKATGEVMAIDRSFESALMKAIRGLEVDEKDLNHAGMRALSDEDLEKAIKTATDERLWALAEGLRRGWGIARVNEISKVDPWFLDKIQTIISQEQPEPNCFKMVDTCAAEFESATPYYYSSVGQEDDKVPADEREAILVLGSGPIRIGQGIEFDYSCVHAAWALQELGYRSVILNNNPETVSTDFDTADALYFDPVTEDDAMRIAERENVKGVMLQFGGQTAINLANKLRDRGLNILGTSANAIELAEDRDQFQKVADKLGIEMPQGAGVTSVEKAVETADKIGYPVLVRPSFVLGGRAMEIVWNESELRNYMRTATKASGDAPVLVDKYIPAMEAEVDAICDGTDTLIPGIMEHIERAGVHSGDSMAAYPAVTIPITAQKEMIRIASALAKELGVRGMMNIQFVIDGEKAYVLEVNPRASRTVPYLSKAASLPMVAIATKCAMGISLKEQGYASGIWDPVNNAVSKFGIDDSVQSPPDPGLYAVKAPVFSFQKLSRVEPSLGPEMKSTGEVLGIDFTYAAALSKALEGSGIRVPQKGVALITVRNQDKAEACDIARTLASLGFDLLATGGTAKALTDAGLKVESIPKISEDPDRNVATAVRSGQVKLLINTSSADRDAEAEAMQIRRTCVETGIPCLTNIDTAKALATALQLRADGGEVNCLSLDDYTRKA
jgi:carbamoyl-phosphate synthase large subunit